jgi:hypothetical protein
MCCLLRMMEVVQCALVVDIGWGMVFGGLGGVVGGGAVLA